MASILVAGPDFGTGSSREHAVWALQNYGFKAVISSRFADIFRGNSGKAGLLAAQVDEKVVQRLWDWLEDNPGGEITVDLVSRTVRAGVGEGAVEDGPPSGEVEARGVVLLAVEVSVEPGARAVAVDQALRDLRHERTVAVKVLRPDVSAEIGAERFLREIKMAARLTHAGSVAQESCTHHSPGSGLVGTGDSAVCPPIATMTPQEWPSKPFCEES